MNFRVIFLTLGLLLSFLAVSQSYAAEPKNLDLVKQDLARYHDSEEYEKDIARVIQQAKEYLKARLTKNKAKHNNNQKLAMVLDIDETSLSNYPALLNLRFGGLPEQMQEAQSKSVDEAIEPTLELYQYAKSKGVAVFFISARREDLRAPTVTNLESAGYKNYEGLYLMPMDYHEKSAAGFKTDARKKIVEQGYDIVLSIGDQKSDLRGKYADKAFKLPDPFYIVP